MATIADVARLAGVSKSTVSHVLNGTRFVSPETEQVVRDAVNQTGYTPNTLARALARSASNSVGIAISGASNPYFGDIIRAVERECARFGMTVFLTDTHDDPEKELDVVMALHQRRVDGIILAPASDTEQGALAYLLANKIPAVLVDRLASEAFDQVGVRNAQSLECLVDHLIDHGHRRIGMLPGQPAFATTNERIEGFEKAIRRRQLDPAQCPIAIGSIDVETLAHRTVEMLSMATPPTALVAGSNMASIGVMRGLKRLKLVVPRDMAVVGFDDFEWADCFEPQLTVVAQPCVEIGRTAAEMLLERIKRLDREPRTVRLKTELIIRNSCGCQAGSPEPS